MEKIITLTADYQGLRLHVQRVMADGRSDDTILATFTEGRLQRVLFVEAAKQAVAATLADFVCVEGNHSELHALKDVLISDAKDDVSIAIRNAFAESEAALKEGKETENV